MVSTVKCFPQFMYVTIKDEFCSGNSSMIAIVVVYDQQMAYFAVIPLLILKDSYTSTSISLCRILLLKTSPAGQRKRYFFCSSSSPPNIPFGDDCKVASFQFSGMDSFVNLMQYLFISTFSTSKEYTIRPRRLPFICFSTASLPASWFYLQSQL